MTEKRLSNDVLRVLEQKARAAKAEEEWQPESGREAVVAPTLPLDWRMALPLVEEVMERRKGGRAGRLKAAFKSLEAVHRALTAALGDEAGTIPERIARLAAERDALRAQVATLGREKAEARLHSAPPPGPTAGQQPADVLHFVWSYPHEWGYRIACGALLTSVPEAQRVDTLGAWANTEDARMCPACREDVAAKMKARPVQGATDVVGALRAAITAALPAVPGLREALTRVLEVCECRADAMCPTCALLSRLLARVETSDRQTGGEGVRSSPLRDLSVGPGRKGGQPAPSGLPFHAALHKAMEDFGQQASRFGHSVVGHILPRPDAQIPSTVRPTGKPGEFIVTVDAGTGVALSEAADEYARKVLENLKERGVVPEGATDAFPGPMGSIGYVLPTPDAGHGAADGMGGSDCPDAPLPTDAED